MSYQQGAKEAYADILEDGALMTVRRVTLAEDDLTGDVTEQIIDQRLPCIVLPDKAVLSDGVIAGSLTAQKSRKCIMAAHGAKFVPANGDKLEYSGKWWAVLGCSPINPDGKTDIIFEFGIQQ